MILREATEQDVKELHQIELQAYGEKEATPLSTFQEIVEHKNTQYRNYRLIVAEEDKKVIGFYCTGVDEERALHLYDIAVSKDAQNRGAGTVMMADLLDYAESSRQFFKVHLTVRKDNLSALKLYEKFQFVQKEVLDNYYDDCDGVTMEYWFMNTQNTMLGFR